MKLQIISFLFILWMPVFSQNKDNPKDYELENLEKDWKESPKTLSKKCDTLIIRQICDYCLGKKSTYSPKKFSSTTSCLCYTYNTYFPDKINHYINLHKDEIVVIVIENPSNIIFKLDFKPLKKLETLSLFGNDYDCDAIKILPDELLKISTFKNVLFNGVRFPGEEIKNLKNKYPQLKLIGTISEYDSSWDNTQKKE
jgi:hypothetical protein